MIRTTLGRFGPSAAVAEANITPSNPAMQSILRIDLPRLPMRIA